MSTPSPTTTTAAVPAKTTTTIATTGKASSRSRRRLLAATHRARNEATAFRAILRRSLEYAGATPIDPTILERDPTLLRYTRRTLARLAIPAGLRRSIEREVRDLEAALERRRDSHEALQTLGAAPGGSSG